MKKETQFLCIVLLCGLTLAVSACGIRPSDLKSPAEVERERIEKEQGIEKSSTHQKHSFPAVYPKPAR